MFFEDFWKNNNLVNTSINYSAELFEFLIFLLMVSLFVKVVDKFVKMFLFFKGCHHEGTNLKYNMLHISILRGAQDCFTFIYRAATFHYFCIPHQFNFLLWVSQSRFLWVQGLALLSYFRVILYFEYYKYSCNWSTT